MTAVNLFISKRPKKVLESSDAENIPRYKNYLAELKGKNSDKKSMTTDNIKSMAAYTTSVGAK